VDLSAIRAELAVTLGGLGYTPYPSLPGSPELPAVVINPPELIEYHLTLDGLSRITMAVSVFVPTGDMEQAQLQLNRAVSYQPGSLVQLIEAHEPESYLSLVVQRSASPYRIGDDTAAKAFGVDLIIQIHA
jgi:hypothetical protein